MSRALDASSELGSLTPTGSARPRNMNRDNDVEMGGTPTREDIYKYQKSAKVANAPISSGTVLMIAVPIVLVLIYLGLKTNWVVMFVFSVTVASLLFAFTLAQQILAIQLAPDQENMLAISEPIREGAEGFFKTQYGTISRLSVLLFFCIIVIYSFRQTTPEQDAAGISKTLLAAITACSFMLGAACSGIAGYTGMWVSVRANVRVAAQARRSMRASLYVALRAGAFAALVVVGLTVLGVTFLFALCHLMLGYGSESRMKPSDVPMLLVGYGFGASFVALFAQLGGGIYTKAADVGADLVGKVEANIPEDDPRNPAVIADLVGDNVGDCAARGADLFESIAAEIISAMILGATMAKKANLTEAEMTGFMMFPLVVHCMDLGVSGIGILSVRPEAPPGTVKEEDPLEVMKKGYTLTLGLAVVGFGLACYTMLSVAAHPGAWVWFFGCGVVGMAAAYLFVWISQYYTDYKYRPVRQVADASSTGHGTNVIAGVALGMESTAMPVVVISIAIVLAYWFGKQSGLTDKEGAPCGGLFGTAVATMGMLSTAAYVLAMDIFGPIADNAGGIVEMSSQPAQVREITDALDSVGNTTKATTKGFAIGSAALASFLLFSAYMDEVSAFTGQPFVTVDIAVPEVFVGGLLGSMLVYLFSAWACKAVGKSAQEVVEEVRRQFLERPGIMTYQEKPDHGRCVSIVAESALREMSAPGMLAVSMPIVVGVVFRQVGLWTGQEMLGAKVVAGFLMFATVAGILMALFLNTAGGAWDNAKKYVETGALGGKGSDTHKAAVTGDTVGDPFKDTAGPSIHVLIKMLATITLVMAPLFLD